MTVARVYRMTAAEGKADALAKALGDVVATIRSVSGSEGVELLQDADQPHQFLFIEKWTSVEAHQAAFSQMPAGTLDEVSAAMAGPPDGAYFNSLKTA